MRHSNYTEKGKAVSVSRVSTNRLKPETQLSRKENMKQMKRDPIIESMKPAEQWQYLQVRQETAAPKRAIANWIDEGQQLRLPNQG